MPSFPFIVSLSTAALVHRIPASAKTSRDSCHAQTHGKRVRCSKVNEICFSTQDRRTRKSPFTILFQNNSETVLSRLSAFCSSRLFCVSSQCLHKQTWEQKVAVLRACTYLCIPLAKLILISKQI